MDPAGRQAAAPQCRLQLGPLVTLLEVQKTVKTHSISKTSASSYLFSHKKFQQGRKSNAVGHLPSEPETVNEARTIIWGFGSTTDHIALTEVAPRPASLSESYGALASDLLKQKTRPQTDGYHRQSECHLLTAREISNLTPEGLSSRSPFVSKIWARNDPRVIVFGLEHG